MCVSKLAHKGGYHFFLVLISLMWMACGSYSEKLHVIPGSHLELSAPELSPGNAHYLQPLQDLVVFAARGHSHHPSAWQLELGPVAVLLWGARGAAGLCEATETRLK